MGIKAYIGITDSDWFSFLGNRPDLHEVNFWQPSGGRNFRALRPGGLFLFKLHAPRHFIVGGGFFAHFSRLPYRMSWELFGEKNGAATRREMGERIARYRKVKPNRFEDYEIGNVILSQPFFLPETAWIPSPSDFYLNIVQGKRYDLTEGEGRRLWEALQPWLVAGGDLRERAQAGAVDLYGMPILVRPRLGQGGFRALVTDTYKRRCAITGERALPVLEAAHILPVSEGGQHESGNGIHFRSDIHRLFDRGYVSVAPDGRFLVSPRLKTDFDNGEPYYPLAGQRVWAPHSTADRPRREHLEWHADTVFRH